MHEEENPFLDQEHSGSSERLLLIFRIRHLNTKSGTGRLLEAVGVRHRSDEVEPEGLEFNDGAQALEVVSIHR